MLNYMKYLVALDKSYAFFFSPKDLFNILQLAKYASISDKVDYHISESVKFQVLLFPSSRGSVLVPKTPGFRC